MPTRLIRKQCPVCGETKDRMDFGERLGHNGQLWVRDKCRKCAAEAQRNWRNQNHDLALSRKLASRNKNPTSHIAYNRAWNKTERGRLVIRTAVTVYRALNRGVLVKPVACEQCGRTGRIEAAHHDYSKPLDVLWLCRFCHAKWDHYEPKTTPNAVASNK